MKALDMRMNWVEASKIIAASLQDGTAEGKQLARQELHKMALAADMLRGATDALRELTELKAIKRRIDGKTATPAERVQYKSRKEPAWKAAETLLARIAP